MKKNWNSKNINFENSNYISDQNQNTYYKHSFNYKTTKTNKFYNNKKSQKYNYYPKNDYSNENAYLAKYSDIQNCESFYPKNYAKYSNQLENEYNNNEKNLFYQNKNNEFSNYENSKNNNYQKNKNEVQYENTIKNSLDKEPAYPNENHVKEEHIEKEEKYEKPKKYGIKSIPHPKRKKGHRNGYIPGKKASNYHQKKEEEEIIKKERKLSISSSKTNFDSAKHSISTLNTSSSSYKEKDVLNDEKKNINCNDNQINIEQININNGIITKNKFDETNEIKQNEQINPFFENTEILKVNVKISENKTVTFKLRRFDDLFYTISLFCEINLIDENLIKPLIIKSLSTINTIYQVLNSKIEPQNISKLELIKNIDDIQSQE